MCKVIYVTITLLFIALFPPTAQAFDTYVAHPLLARASAEQYNHTAVTPLSTQEIEWLTQGSLEEDEPIIRAFNHFYNPLTGEGLKVAGVPLGLPSPRWALDSLAQSFQLGGDCSWQTAVRAYNKQDKAAGLRCLGHVLHLIQDAGVPAHTRNDQHMTGDTLESWAKFTNPAVPEIQPAVYPQCQTPADCIKEIAAWINSHFLSEDTVRDRAFPLPYAEAIVEDGYLTYDGRKIAIYHPGRRSFVLNSEIMAEYWQSISPVVAEFGKRLLEIFFKEVNKDSDKFLLTEPAPLSSPTPVSIPTSTTTVSLPTSTLNPPPRSLSSLGVSQPVLLPSEKSSLPPPNHPKPVAVEQTQSSPITSKEEKSAPPLTTFLNTILPSFLQIGGSTLPDTYYTTRPASRTSSQTAEFVITSDTQGVSFECRLNNEDWLPCLSSYQRHNLSEGTHTLEARAVSTTGKDQSPIRYSWTIDLTPPISYLIPQIQPQSREAQFTFGSELGSHFQCRLDIETWSECSSPQLYQDLASGSHTFFVRAIDQVGNIETISLAHTWTINSEAPSPPTLEFPSTSPFYTEQETIILRGQTIEGTVVKINESSYTITQTGQAWESEQTLVIGENIFSIVAENTYGEASIPVEIIVIRYTVGDSNHIVISQILAEGTGGDKAEFIELYNPTNHIIMLEDIRLEKKTALGFFWDTIVQESQFESMIIQPKGYFLIAGQDYTFDAFPDIQIEEELLHNNSGHIRLVGRLGEEIDKIGYGSASQPEGLAAPLLTANISLERKAHYSSTPESLRAHPEQGNGYDSNFNYFDFVLQSIVFPRASDYQAGIINLDSNLIHLWHLDECNGQTKDSITNRSHPQPTTWIVGKYGCALSQYWPAYEDIYWSLSEPVPVGEVSISFYAREPVYAARSYMWFIDGEGNVVAGIRSNNMGDAIWWQGQEITLPSSLPSDGMWHQITVVFSHNYLGWYRDGVMISKRVGNYTWNRPVTNLNIGEDNLWWQLDEIAIWQEALSNPEVEALTHEQLSPRLIRPSQPQAQLRHFWNFNEGTSPAVDSIGAKSLTYPQSVPGREGTALALYWYQSPQVNGDIALFNSKDISLSYWRRRSDQGNGGGYVGLYNTNAMMIFGSGGGYLQSYYLFNGNSDSLGAHIPDDELWHHIAIVYDSYQYRLKYYIDGVEKGIKEMIWPLLPYNKLVMREDQYGFYVDDLKIWEGTLTAEEVSQEAQLP